MTNFSETLIRCSALGQIMTNAKGKSPMEQYEDAVSSISSNEEKYENFKNKEIIEFSLSKLSIFILIIK